MCFPRWDSGAVFSSLIGGPGAYAVTPQRAVRVGRLLRAGQPDLAQPLGHRRRDDRVPRGARAARRAPTGRSILRRVIAREGTAAGRRRARPARRLRPARAARACASAMTASWTGELGDARIWLGRRRRTRARSPTATAARRSTLDARARARAPTTTSSSCSPATRPTPSPRTPTGRGRATEAALARPRARRSSDTVAPRDARHAYAVLSGLTSAGGGMVAAATTSLPERARGGPQLRLPLRRGSATSATPAQAVAKAGPHPLMDDAVRFVADAAARRRARAQARLHDHRRTRCPTSASSTCPGYPGGIGHRRQLGQPAVPARRLRRGAAAVRRRRPPRPPRRRRLAGRRGRGRRDRAALARDRHRRRHLGDRPRRLDAQPADLRRRPAPDRRARPGRRAGRPLGRRSPTGSSPTPPTTPCTHRVAGSAPPAIRASTRRCCCRRSAARSRPTIRARSPRCTPSSTSSPQDGYCYRYRPDERPLGEAEGAFLLCGF